MHAYKHAHTRWLFAIPCKTVGCFGPRALLCRLSLVVRYRAHTITLIPQLGPFVCLMLIVIHKKHAVTPSKRASIHQNIQRQQHAANYRKNPERSNQKPRSVKKVDLPPYPETTCPCTQQITGWCHLEALHFLAWRIHACIWLKGNILTGLYFSQQRRNDGFYEDYGYPPHTRFHTRAWRLSTTSCVDQAYHCDLEKSEGSKERHTSCALGESGCTHRLHSPSTACCRQELVPLRSSEKPTPGNPVRIMPSPHTIAAPCCSHFRGSL